MANTGDKSTRAGEIGVFQVFESKEGTKRFADLSLGCVELSYYEDILSNSVSASAGIVESGLSDAAVGKGFLGILDNLPVVGGESVNLVFRDNKNNPTTLKFLGAKRGNGNEFYVNRVRQVNPGTQRDIYYLDLCTREFISNEQARVVKRYDGTIGENVLKILKGKLSGDGGIITPKGVEIDPTAKPYNFIGNDRKPFYVCTWLAAKSIPVLSVDGKDAIGGAAGYFFYETYDGFKFKAIDVLNGQAPKKKFIFTNTTGLPQGYDAKILDVNVERDIDLQQNLTMGAYANRTLFFDYVNMNYKVRDYTLTENQKDKVNNAGKKSFGDGVSPAIKDAPSRIMNKVLDIGTLPSGVTANDQLEKWKSDPTKSTFASAETVAQSAMRYNQMFTIKINITIAGDFSLRAGDMIFCEFPELTVAQNKLPNKQTGGNYLIASVCHRLTPEDCYTSLTLVRDSFGKKPPAIRTGSSSSSSTSSSRSSSGLSSRERTFARRSSSASAQANTNRFGQNVKTSPNAAPTDWAARRRARRGSS